MKVEIIGDDRFWIVKVNGFKHLVIDASKLIGTHSYIDEMTRPTPEGGTITYPMYYINFHLASGQIVKCEYNRRDLWEQILKGL